MAQAGSFSPHGIAGRPVQNHSRRSREFGAIGNELCYAVGVAAARPHRPIVLMTCGDGGFMMHARELDAIRRYDLPALICVLNDGALWR